MEKYLLETEQITKTFPGVRALHNVSIKIKKGEVHAIVGENGAGKSTLMLTIGGIYKPDSGTIILDGEKKHFHSAKDAQDAGVGIVFQELSLIQELSIAENIFANRQPTSFGFINKKKLINETKKRLEYFDLGHLDPMMLVKELPIATQQVVEILKAMSLNPKILILDEPTSSLTDVEVKNLFKNIKKLKNEGISFIYISHHLHEIFELADRVTVLRDGEYVTDANVSDIDEDFLISKMVGREILDVYGERKEHGDNVVFEARNISKKGIYKDISFTIKSGEILGVSGLVGAGRTEIGRGIFGAEPIDSGELYLNGKLLSIKSPKQAIEKGIGYMSEDRKQQGLYLKFSISTNLIANRLKDFAKQSFMSERDIKKNADDNVNGFRVATPSINQLVGNLSGGNQQKVMLASWMGISPKLLIVDEPTRGVDVGSKNEIYHFLKDLAKSGVAIMMISSDLPEVLGISHRIAVIKNGTLKGIQDGKTATEESIMALAVGSSN